MRVIPFYLPQFHSIPENDEWWGEGFTEWVNVKAAQKFYDWQRQPRIPLNKNYYNLLDEKTQEWQAQLAKEYGVYGFCYYHYWFDGHMLLEKPMERMLENKNIDLPFCICWANENWTNAWVSPDPKVLISQTYGNEDEWESHYRYLSKFFKDSRYIKEDGMPLMIIYRPEIVPCMNEMIDYWQRLAKDDGFPGLKLAYQNAGLDFPIRRDNSRFDYDIEMQPIYAKLSQNSENKRKIKSYILKLLEKFKLEWVVRGANRVKGPKIFDYDEIWHTILDTPAMSNKSVPCAFVDFDNTSRRKEQGWLFKGVTVEKFREYFKAYAEKAKKEYKTDLMFIFAWNEWAEGGYLEPDEDHKYGYLEAIRDVINDK